MLFLIIITVPLLTQQFTNQPDFIYPRDYTSLIATVIIPSPDIAFIYGLGNIVLPLLIISSWILTISLLKPYAGRIGRKKFWVLVSIPLLYQLFSFIMRDANLVTNSALIEIIYSKQLQFVFGIQLSGNWIVLCYSLLDSLKENEKEKHEKLFDNFFVRSSLII